MDRKWDAPSAALLYAAVSLLVTWPLVLGLTRDIPGDFGDPLLNIWILSWGASHAPLWGREWWNAAIFHPHPLALAYSDHLLSQTLQVLPVYALTGNPVLGYNLLFLSTFVLSGLGMYLLVRELTGDRAAALAGGFAYAFAPYRFASLPHLQTMSAAWMPFVLFAFRRYLDRRSPRALAGAAVAWWLQNLSSGYYLLFFTPVVALYLAWEITTRRRWTDIRLIVSLAMTAVAVGIATIPFALPYLELRQRGFQPRSIAETQMFSADVYAYLTADPNARVWGWLAAWPKPEGALFPGIAIAVLAIIAIVRTQTDVGRVFQTRPTGGPEGSALQTIAVGVLGLSLVVIIALLAGFSIRLPGVKITSLSRALTIGVLAAVAMLAVSRGARAAAWRCFCSPAACFVVIAIFAVTMSFGPHIEAKGRLVSELNLYALFYWFVPGFDGLRVPARFGMIVALALAVLASLGLIAISGRRRPQAAAALAALIVLESWIAPIPINENSADYKRPGLAPLPDKPASAWPPVYDAVSTLPPGTAIVELPLGEPAFDVRYMFYSIRHRKPLVNGYSGGQPVEYALLDQMLQDALAQPDRAWTVLAASQATHAVVHEAFYAGDRGPRISGWLREHGAREVGLYGADRLFVLPGR